MNGYNRLASATAGILSLLVFSAFPLAGRAETEAASSPTATTPFAVSSPTPPAAGIVSTDRTGQGLIVKGQTLNVEQCIDIALRKNPGILSAVNLVSVSKSRVGEARASYYPQLKAEASYSRVSPVAGAVGSSLGPRYDQYTGTVILTQNILDFGRISSSVNAAKHGLESSRADLIYAEQNTVLSVKQAYYGVLQAKRNRDVAADVIKQFQLHLEQAKGFYEVGTKAKIDVIKAEVDLSNAQLSLINAENTLKIAWVNLNNAMGVPDAPEYSIVDDLSFTPYTITLEEATGKAFENRADLKSTIEKKKAAESNVSYARSQYYPVLSGSASYSKAGIDQHPSELNDGWQAGVTLTIPLFSGFLTSHQVAEARANVYVLQANEETMRQQILLEVRQAYLNLQAAEAGIGTSELAVKQAKENLDLANGRYAAGVGSPVEVSDAFTTYVTVQGNYTTTLANYKIARANLVRAMGMR